jgi:DNA polymerase I-like protein with 3'-5' exonuclease and polymerase domains
MKISVRSMVRAPKGKVLVAADLSQAESWIVAYSAEEQNMQYSLNESDIHTDSASALFYPDSYCTHKWKKENDTHQCTVEDCGIVIVKTARYIGKRYNHASAYRMKPPKAATVINKDSDKPPFVTVTLSESRMYSERWHNRYRIKGWWTEIEHQLNINRTLVTPYGRSRTFFAQWGEELFKEATAYVPQSTVADHFNGMVHPELGISGGLREIRRKLVKPYSLERRIINQSHDSCIIECPTSDGEELCQSMMRLLKRPLVIKNTEFTIPVDGEIGERWGEMESRKLAV